MAARPAIDSLMPCIRGASWGPVNSHCPIRRGPVSGIHGNRAMAALDRPPLLRDGSVDFVGRFFPLCM